MNLYDTISQFDLNNLIDLLLANYHKELGLSIDDSENSYCGLDFDLSDGVDAGSEVVFNSGDELIVDCTDMRLAEMSYILRLQYYQLDKGDYVRSKRYDDLKTLDVVLDSGENIIPFSDDQIYLQKGFTLVLMGSAGYHLLLQSDKGVYAYGESVVLTAEYSQGTVPVEDATVSFYQGDTLLGTGVTDANGVAHYTVSNLTIGTFNFRASCGDANSSVINVRIGSDKIMELNVTGSSFSSYNNSPFTYTGQVYVDWGDGTDLVEYTGGQLSHTFSDGLSSHTVKVYGELTSLGEYCFRNCTGLTSISLPDNVTSLGWGCFYGCTGLTSISIPNGVTSLGWGCFYNCTGLTSITLNWQTSSTIITYNSNWINNTSSTLKFHIPQDTTTLYTDKSYPNNKLVEDTT